MHVYLLFLLMAGATVLSPGPGVVMTLSNALRFGARGTMGGVLGIATGALVVAVAGDVGGGIYSVEVYRGGLSGVFGYPALAGAAAAVGDIGSRR